MGTSSGAHLGKEERETGGVPGAGRENDKGGGGVVEIWVGFDVAGWCQAGCWCGGGGLRYVLLLGGVMWGITKRWVGVGGAEKGGVLGGECWGGGVLWKREGGRVSVWWCKKANKKWGGG